jgi:hypothetical protein
MDKLLGWTIEQWALALNSNDAELNSIPDFLRFKRNYLEKHNQIDPIEIPTIINKEGDIRERNWDKAFELQDLVHQHLYTL